LKGQDQGQRSRKMQEQWQLNSRPPVWVYGGEWRF